MHPENADQPMPIVLTGPKQSEAYFRSLDKFITDTLGEAARKHYSIAIDNPAEAARIMSNAMPLVRQHRKDKEDAYSFNWSLKIEPEFQLPFEPNHESMANLDLHLNQRPEVLAANLRRAFSGVVAGNVKAEGIREIERHGPFEMHGDPVLMKKMDQLLNDFVAQNRMKLPGGSAYEPCYKIVT
ncbi:LOG family protein, partial [Vibrio cholerae]